MARGDGPGFLSRVPVRTSDPIVMREPPKPKAVAGSPRTSAPVAKKQIGQHPKTCPPAGARRELPAAHRTPRVSGAHAALRGSLDRRGGCPSLVLLPA